MKTTKRTAATAPAKKRKTCKSKLINKVWFTDQFAARNISQRQLAFKVGMDPAAMSLVLSGKRKLQIPEAEAIAGELGIPVTDVLANAGLDMAAGASQDALVAGWVGNMGDVHEGRVDGPRRVNTPTGMGEATRVLRFQGNDATDGWLAFYQPGKGVRQDCIGRLCVVRTQQGAAYVARLMRGYTAGVWNLIDLFGRGGMIEGVRVADAAPVQWIRCVMTG